MKLRGVAILLAGVCLASCATPPPAFAPASSRTGVVEWRREGVDLHTRVVFQSASPDDRRLVVGAERPLLTLTRRGGEWFAAGAIAGRAWRGPENTAPAVLAGWISLVEAFDGASSVPSGESDVRTGRFSVRYEKAGEELRAIELVTVATGDRFRVTFPPGPAR